MTDLVSIFRAGLTRRWHANPDLADTCDRVDGHSARVARIILAIHPAPSLAVVAAALQHDDGEGAPRGTGDMPWPFKASLPEPIRAAFASWETDAAREVWGIRHADSDDPWIKLADRLDALMWVRHHAPHVLVGDGWPEAIEDIRARAIALGCTAAVWPVIGWAQT